MAASSKGYFEESRNLRANCAISNNEPIIARKNRRFSAKIPRGSSFSIASKVIGRSFVCVDIYKYLPTSTHNLPPSEAKEGERKIRGTPPRPRQGTSSPAPLLYHRSRTNRGRVAYTQAKGAPY